MDVQLANIEIGKIHIPEKRRLPDAEIEPELIRSIKENGLLYPIIIVPYEGNPGHFVLVAGMNRLNAFFKLKQSHIQAYVYPAGLDETTRKLIEIEENLCRADLTKSQRLKALVKQKELYELKYPETRKGFINRQPEGERRKSFVKVQAEKLGRSERYVFDEIAVGKKLDDEALEILESSKNKRFANSRIDLEQLSKNDSYTQIAIAEIVKKDEVGSYPEAYRRYMHPEDFEEDLMTKEEKKELKQMVKEYAKGTEEQQARRKFIEFISELPEQSRICLKETLPIAIGEGVTWEKKNISGFIKAISEAMSALDDIKWELEKMESDMKSK